MGYDASSDYGSDFTPDEEDILSSLLAQAPATPREDSGLILTNIEDDESPQRARIPHAHEDYHQQSVRNSIAEQTAYLPIEIADSSNPTADVEDPESRSRRDRHERSVSIEAPVNPPPVAPEPEGPDLRSPLERFRSRPMKPLSVTDLVSPSWCELQYWFTLTKHGKKKRTPAMKQGSAVHKTLEEEVHRTVAVDIATKEDAWGLRFWNIIQGLRTLRETGMTRELEVWGVLDGLVVNGVIDELSYICPDRELEATEITATNIPSPLPANQKSIVDFLSPNGSQTFSQDNFGAATRSSRPSSKEVSRIYVTDVKTRNTSFVPRGASFRPTTMQLMLYRRLLTNMATNNVDTNILFSHYRLQPDQSFTDGFIAQISEMYYDAPSDPSQTSDSDLPSSTPEYNYDTVDLLLSHNSLNQLWSLMMREFHATFPHGEKSIGNVLQAEYRNALDGLVMGSRAFLYDKKTLDTYVEEELRWWRGERPAVGVCIEEAYKCGICEFAEECGWRKGKIEEAREKMRMGRERRRSAV
ncbi:MAG: hypothetical protein LQ343_006932 [Gyalolechia ehrenbergii]|nr:MAG: hypothetical protein LQ343_006932 [Gyalolechia ehrenbergii]